MTENYLFAKGDIAHGYYPLRPMQRWIINTHFNKAKSTMMNISTFVKIDPDIDIHRLKNVMDEFLESYDIFRCRFVFHPETGELCQRFDGELQPVTIEKFSDADFEELQKHLIVPYELINHPLYTFRIFETPSANYVYMDFYHAILDGAAFAILFYHETRVRYQGQIPKRVPMKYADYIEEESKIPAADLEEGFKYWREMTKIFDAKKHLPPADFEREETWQQNIILHDFKNIDSGYFVDKTRTENIFFLAACMLAIAKSAHSKTAMLGWVHNGRHTAKELRLVGLMMEQYPISWNFEDDTTVENFLDKLEAKLDEEITYRKSLGVTYLEGLQDDCATFIFQKSFFPESFFVDGKSNEVIENLPNELSAAENSLDMEVNTTRDGKYFIKLDYDADRYAEQSMKNFAELIDEIIFQLQDEKISVAKILG